MDKQLISVFIAGDSTASYYDENRAPRAGWGQVIQMFFSEDVIIKNRAVSGRSSKSFIEEGYLKKIEKEISPNDYLLIQFGHNDEKPDVKRHTEPYSTYKDCLKEYINVARKNNAFPVLLTPVNRRAFNDEDKIVLTHGEYPDAMKQLALEMNVPLIDICKKSKKLFEELGEDETKKIFLWLNKGEHINYPEGVQDNTHFSMKGAIEIARLIVDGIKEIDLPLASFIKNRVGHYYEMRR